MHKQTMTEEQTMNKQTMNERTMHKHTMSERMMHTKQTMNEQTNKNQKGNLVKFIDKVTATAFENINNEYTTAQKKKLQIHQRNNNDNKLTQELTSSRVSAPK